MNALIFLAEIGERGSSVLPFLIAIVGTIATVYILYQRGHRHLVLLGVLVWPLALLISLCIPVRPKPVASGVEPSPSRGDVSNVAFKPIDDLKKEKAA
jgi:hypothetical protein